MIRIRRSTPADVPALIQVWRRAVDATHNFLTPEDRLAIDAQVCEYLPNGDFLIAEEDGTVAGFLGGSGRHIDAIFIDPQWHGRGIGTMLIDRFAGSSGEPLRVEVNEQNGGARQFYERRGFKVVGRSPLDDQGRPYPLLHMERPGAH